MSTKWISAWIGFGTIVGFAALISCVVIFGPWFLFRLTQGPDMLLNREEAKKNFVARQDFIERYKKVLSEARETRNVVLCKDLPVSIYFYQTNAEGEVQYTPDYSGGPLRPGNLFALPNFDCSRAYAVDFIDPSACDKDKAGLNDIQHEVCLMEVGHEMRRRNSPNWKSVCTSIQTRDERSLCEQDVINPEKDDLETPQGLSY